MGIWEGCRHFSSTATVSSMKYGCWCTLGQPMGKLQNFCSFHLELEPAGYSNEALPWRYGTCDQANLGFHSTSLCLHNGHDQTGICEYLVLDQSSRDLWQMPAKDTVNSYPLGGIVHFVSTVWTPWYPIDMHRYIIFISIIFPFTSIFHTVFRLTDRPI